MIYHGSNQNKRKHSRTLLRTGVNEMGLRSESTDFGLATFAIGTGITSAHFQRGGKVPCATLTLKIEQMGRARRGQTTMNPSSGSLFISNPSVPIEL